MPKKIERTSDNLDKQPRILNEVARLKGIYKDLPKETLNLNDGLIKRAAYMLVTLEDYELDLDTRGYVEQFSQSEKLEPYERERPVARLYNTMNKNYQSIMKQLSELIPKPDLMPRGDGFDDFLNRDD
jgi:hypothetical protein